MSKKLVLIMMLFLMPSLSHANSYTDAEARLDYYIAQQTGYEYELRERVEGNNTYLDIVEYSNALAIVSIDTSGITCEGDHILALRR